MKIFLGTFIGLIMAFVSIGLLEQIGHSLFPIPFEIDPADLSDLKAQLHLIPVGAYVTVVVAHGIGLFLGCLVAGKIDNKTPYSVYIVAGFLIVGTIANLFMIPHPLWFGIADVAIVTSLGVLFIIKAKKRIA